MVNLENWEFRNFLNEKDILPQVDAADKEELIGRMVARLTEGNAELSAERIVAAVMEREEIMPTVIAPGLAVPHAKIDKIDGLKVALATTCAPLAFGSPEQSDFYVDVAVLILTPYDDPGLHLQVLSALAREFKDPEKIKEITACRSAADVMHFFSGNTFNLPTFLRAGDLVDTEAATLLESDTLRTAIDTFARDGVDEVPVLDEDGDLRGTLSQEDILSFSLPDHLLWLDDLTSIQRFEPFAQVLREDEETKLADFMRDPACVVEADVPAIQLAKLFLMHKIRQIIVTKNGRYTGVVNLSDFNNKLFWE